MLTRQFLFDQIWILKQTHITESGTKKQILFHPKITFHLLCKLYVIRTWVHNATRVSILYACQTCGLAGMFQYQKYKNIWGGEGGHADYTEIAVKLTL